MWWLQDAQRPEERRPAERHPEGQRPERQRPERRQSERRQSERRGHTARERAIHAPIGNVPPAATQGNAIPSDAVKLPAATAKICRTPLVDLLTPAQRQANRLLDEIAFASIDESASLRSDIKSLEAAIRVHRTALEAEKIAHEMTRRQSEYRQRRHQACERVALDSVQFATSSTRSLCQTVKELEDRVVDQSNDKKSLVSDLDLAVADCEQLRFEIQQSNQRQAKLTEQLARTAALEDRIAELKVELEDANRRAEEWRGQASRGNTAKRAASEQADRYQCLLREKTSELERLAEESESLIAKSVDETQAAQNRQLVLQLRSDRQQSELSQQANAVVDLQRELDRVKQSREEEISRATVSFHEKLDEIRQLTGLVAQRDADVGFVFNALVESQERADRLQVETVELRDKQERLIQLQSTQYNEMRVQIEELIAKLEGQREENRIQRIDDRTRQDDAERVIALLTNQRDWMTNFSQASAKQAKNRLAELESEIVSLSDQAKSLREREMHEREILAQAVGLQADLHQETSRMRARLSGGQAKGQALIQRHNEKVASLKKELAAEIHQRSMLNTQIEQSRRVIEQRDAEIEQRDAEIEKLRQQIGFRAA